ncbi:MAG: hypothetical protein CMIDDMOC_00570 [Sodalis sp. Fle]|nr:MAG: hypothetical protein CMIDDMOC_00570 [Sodalis sp. Fle]
MVKTLIRSIAINVTVLKNGKIRTRSQKSILSG